MKPHKLLWIILAGLALLLSACNAPDPTNNPTQTQSDPTTAASPTHTQAPQPTTPPTATQEPQRVILVAPPGSDSGLAQSAAALLGQLSAAEGMTFEEMPGLASAPPRTRLVVYLNPDMQIKNLAGNTPEVQFVAIGTLDLRPLEANLSQITLQPEAAAFLAGYVAALAAPDWRAGGLLVNAPAGLEQAFIRGGRFHCGRCAPQYAPIVLFPVAKALPAGSDGTSAWEAFKELDANLLEVIYLDPALTSVELLEQLSAKNVRLIGTSLPGEDLRPQWIASVRADSLAALLELWPDLLAGTGGAALNAPLVVDEVNPDLLSEGRLRLVQELAEQLQSGLVSPSAP